MTEFIFIRHAPIDRSTGIYIGASDVDILQGEGSPENFVTPMADFYLSSPKKRCLQTAALCGVKIDKIDDRFAEQNFGDFEGKTYDAVWAETKNWESWNMPHVLTPPNGESFLDVCERVRQGLAQYATIYRGRKLCIFTHAGVIRAAHCALAGVSPAEALALKTDYWGITRLKPPSTDTGNDFYK